LNGTLNYEDVNIKIESVQMVNKYSTTTNINQSTALALAHEFNANSKKTMNIKRD